MLICYYIYSICVPAGDSSAAGDAAVYLLSILGKHRKQTLEHNHLSRRCQLPEQDAAHQAADKPDCICISKAHNVSVGFPKITLAVGI